MSPPFQFGSLRFGVAYLQFMFYLYYNGHRVTNSFSIFIIDKLLINSGFKKIAYHLRFYELQFILDLF